MKVIIPIAESDLPKIDSFEWAINHFGLCKNHELIVVSSPGSYNIALNLFNLIKDNFNNNSKLHVFKEQSPMGWPSGPNFYWKNTIELLKKLNNKSHWLWMETDLIPLKENWLNLLELEYYTANKPFMGSVESNKIYTRSGIEIKTGHHMVGVGIYPADVDKYIRNWKYVDDINKAFDWVCGHEMVPQTHNTESILNAFRTNLYQIKNNRITSESTNYSELKNTYVRPITRNTILHHGCKDGSLVNLIKQNNINLFI